jgi:hypothetical protein
MNRLQQRLAHIERASSRRDGCARLSMMAPREARIARCRAETDLSALDLLVILKPFFDRAPGEAPEPPWTMRPLVGLKAVSGAGSYGPQKGFANVLPHPRWHRQA